MTSPKPINFRPNLLEDAILDRLLHDYGKMTKSELVRLCIRQAGENLLTDEEYKELLLYSAINQK